MPTTSPTLTELERKIIELERLWWAHPGAKGAAIREGLGMSSTRYYQVLNALLDREDVLAFDPMVVNRLRRLRDSRQRSRSVRR